MNLIIQWRCCVSEVQLWGAPRGLRELGEWSFIFRDHWTSYPLPQPLSRGWVLEQSNEATVVFAVWGALVVVPHLGILAKVTVMGATALVVIWIEKRCLFTLSQNLHLAEVLMVFELVCNCLFILLNTTYLLPWASERFVLCCLLENTLTIEWCRICAMHQGSGHVWVLLMLMKLRWYVLYYLRETSKKCVSTEHYRSGRKWRKNDVLRGLISRKRQRWHPIRPLPHTHTHLFITFSD